VERFIRNALTAVGFTIFSPVILWCIAFVAVLAFFVLVVLFAAVVGLAYALAGETGGFLAALGIIAATALGHPNWRLTVEQLLDSRC
jgi:hypothetical protein